MKRILIVGKGSYVGTSFEKWLSRWRDDYRVDTIDTLGNTWRDHGFQGYDSVLHVAGIAHVTNKPDMEALYLKVNRDLAIEVAAKAKAEGVRQFIFMSSMIIYGNDGQMGRKMVITTDTVPQPTNVYGRSKLEADLAIQAMADENFKPVIIRSPMVYGPGCKGNFPKLVKLVWLCPIFPDIDNERSMIYIDNLSEFIRICISDGSSGVFYPQNQKYLSTKEIVENIGVILRRRVYFTKVFNPILFMLSKKVSLLNKVFGNKTYDQSLSLLNNGNYIVCSNQKSIERSCL